MPSNTSAVASATPADSRPNKRLRTGDSDIDTVASSFTPQQDQIDGALDLVDDVNVRKLAPLLPPGCVIEEIFVSPVRAVPNESLMFWYFCFIML